MSETTTVSFQEDGPLAILTMANEPHNLIGPTLMEDLLDALKKAQEAGCRAVLLKSGLRHFSAGAELSLFGSAMEGGDLAVSPVAFLEAMESFPLPIVAAVHGVCVGGGFELALTCDFIIAARSAKIGSVEVTLGLNPLMGAVQRQVERGGSARAKEMSMLGRRYDAETLERWNMINRVVDDEHLEEAAHALATELANGPTVAHRITKELANLAAREGVGAADAIMEARQGALWASEDLKIGMESLSKNGPGMARFKGK
jgi:enoyl-CoA hydratase/carnithine racemase